MDLGKALDHLSTTNPSETHSVKDGKAYCKWCGKEIEPKMHLEIKGRPRRPFGAKRCNCPEATAYWTERDELVRRDEALRAEAERREKLDKLFAQSLLPARWKARTFDAFEVTDYNRRAYEASKRYVEQFDPMDGKGLIFSGPVGRGKSHLAAAIAMELMMQNRSVIYGTVTRLLGQIRNTFDDNKETEQRVFDRLTRCHLLVIDDLGKEKVSNNRGTDVSWTEQTLYEIINARYDNNKAIVITTNMDIFKLPMKYEQNGPAMLSRLMEICREVPMNGPDWRAKGLED